MGYREMENDAINSVISTEQQKVEKVNYSLVWITISRSARIKGVTPYIFHEITDELLHNNCKVGHQEHKANKKA